MIDRHSGSAPPSRTERRRLHPEARRAEIVEAARAVFFRLGYAATSFRAVASAANVSESLLYRYFSSKDELFEVAIRQPLEALLREVQDASSAVARGTTGERPELLEQFHQRMLTAIARLTPYVGIALFAGDGDSGRFYLERMRPLLVSATNVLRESLGGSGAPTVEETVAITALFGMYFGVDIDAVLRGRQLDVAEMSGQLARLLAYGLAGRGA
jgi:AcrR family transcriptional regulator